MRITKSIASIGIAGSLGLLAIASAHAEAPTPKKPVISPPPVQPVITPSLPNVVGAFIQTKITGTLKFHNCAVRLTDVTVTAGDKRVTAVGDPADDFGYRYEIVDLPPGTYTVTPQLANGKCPGGAWAPGNRTVTLTRGSTQTAQGFEYRVATQTRRINAGLLAAVLEGAFSGTQLRLNNYGERRGDSWFKPNDSWLRLPATLGGSTSMLQINEARVGAGRRYYVSDVNLERVSVTAQATNFRISFHFESGGTEIKGRCSGNATCFGASDDAAPDFQVNGARLDILLTPLAYAAGLSYAVPPQAAFHATVDGTFVGEILDNVVERELKQKIPAAAVQALSSATVRRNINDALRRSLAGFGIGAVHSVRMENGSLVIEYSPPSS